MIFVVIQVERVSMFANLSFVLGKKLLAYGCPGNVRKCRKLNKTVAA